MGGLLVLITLFTSYRHVQIHSLSECRGLSITWGLTLSQSEAGP
jgi:hypothetical protein